MADTMLGNGYYKDDKGVYQFINGKKSYLDESLNTDNSQLVTTRGGLPIYKDTNGDTITYQDGIKIDLATKEPIEIKLLGDKAADFIKTNGEQLSSSWYKYNDQYFCIYDDGSVVESTKELYESTQRTPEEQARVDAANEKAEDEKAESEKQALTNYRNDVIAKMQNFNNMLQRLDNKFCKNRAVYTMYFKLEMKDGTVLVDTTSQDYIENCFVSFNHTLTGSGEANSFTLEVLFKPSDRSIISIKNIESTLLYHCSVYATEEDLKELDDMYYNCTFQYGYGDDESMRSDKYFGTIMKYNCNLENGNLRYTIEGHCGLYSAKEYRISPKDEYLTTADGAEISSPLEYIKRIFEVEFSENNEYALDFVNILDLNKVKFPGDGYKNFSQKNIFQVISDILNGCITEKQYQAMSDGKSYYPSQQTVFGYYINDKSTKAKYGEVIIYQLDNINDEDGKSEESKKAIEEMTKPDCNIIFDWFAPTSGAYNHIVIGWNPQFEGVELMALATTYKKGGDTYQTLNDEGEIEDVKSFGAARLGVGANDKAPNNMILSSVQEYSTWSFITQYPYKATMTIIGCPCEVPLTGRIGVIAKMGNEEHHSSGTYMIRGKKDKINSSGFITEFELFKITKTYAPKHTSSTTDDSQEKKPPYSDTIDKLIHLQAEYKEASRRYNESGSDADYNNMIAIQDKINEIKSWLQADYDEASRRYNESGSDADYERMTAIENALAKTEI